MEKQIKKFTYLKERKIIERLDLLPFLVLQSIAVIFYAQEDLHHLIKLVLFVLLILFQAIVFFSKFWSHGIHLKLAYNNQLICI